MCICYLPEAIRRGCQCGRVLRVAEFLPRERRASGADPERLRLWGDAHGRSQEGAHRRPHGHKYIYMIAARIVLYTTTY